MISSDIPPPGEPGSSPQDVADVPSDFENAGAAGDAGEAPEAASAPASAAPESLAAELSLVRDRWLRTEAELQNYRRRAQRDVEEARRSAEERALLDLIEYLDDLDRTLAAAREAGKDASWVQGVELVAQRMRDGLARAGVVAIASAGEPFDPRQHEALIELPAPAGTPAGTVMHVERTGYRRGERVLRPARVTVAGDATEAR